MRTVSRSGNFKRQYQLMKRRGATEAKILSVIALLASDEPLPPRCRDHALTGKLAGFRDCHIQQDWILIYQKHDSADGQGVLRLEATGTHADLF